LGGEGSSGGGLTRGETEDIFSVEAEEEIHPAVTKAAFSVEDDYCVFHVRLIGCGVEAQGVSRIRDLGLALWLPFSQHREVRIISRKAIRKFAAKHCDSGAALETWFRVVRQAQWTTGAEVKETFSKSDSVGDKTVFDIALNRYRLIAFIDFRNQAGYIKAILTHKEYDKGGWK